MGINSISGAGVIGNWIFRVCRRRRRTHCTHAHTHARHTHALPALVDSVRYVVVYYILKSRLCYYNNRLRAPRVGKYITHLPPPLPILAVYGQRPKTRANCRPDKETKKKKKTDEKISVNLFYTHTYVYTIRHVHSHM